MNARFGPTIIGSTPRYSFTIYLFFFLFVCTLLFLAVGSYARIETVRGVVLPRGGIIEVSASRSGVLKNIAVAEGQWVSKGALLATVDPEEYATHGLPPSERLKVALQLQKLQMRSALLALERQGQSQSLELREKISGSERAAAELSQQADIQMALVASAKIDYEQASSIAARGFLSRRDLDSRRDILLLREKELSQIRQQRQSLISENAALKAQSAQISELYRGQSASKLQEIAQIDEQLASNDAQGAFAVRSPVDGRVSTVTARPGQRANAGAPVMQIIPNGSALEAELTVPSAAVGFVNQGQAVSIGLDAFPYETYGSLQGEISSISRSAILPSSNNSNEIPVFVVRVKLKSAGSAVRSKLLGSLKPGMTLSARIVTGRQSFFEWLFQPLYAIRRR